MPYSSMHPRTIVCLLLACGLQAGCGSMGETGEIATASRLLVDCQHDEALEAISRAEAGGGLSAYIAELERVVILRDAGRYSDADAALARRNEKNQISDEDAAEAERSIEQTLANVREERQKNGQPADCT